MFVSAFSLATNPSHSAIVRTGSAAPAGVPAVSIDGASVLSTFFCLERHCDGKYLTCSVVRERFVATRAFAARFPQGTLAELLRSLAAVAAASAAAVARGDVAAAEQLACYFVFELCFSRRAAVSAPKGTFSPGVPLA